MSKPDIPSDTPPGDAFTFLNGINSVYLAELYNRYLKTPEIIDREWAEIFDQLGDDEASLKDDMTGATWAPREGRVVGSGELLTISDSLTGKIKAESSSSRSQQDIKQATLDSIKALMLIRSYRVLGHYSADLDPLGIASKRNHPELDYTNYGFTEQDLDRPIFINYVLGLETATLREILAICHQTYCSTIGIEFMHILNPTEKNWIQERLETTRDNSLFSGKERIDILDKLTKAEFFERFLDQRHPGTKRFGLDGGEATVPVIEQILSRGSALGVEELVVGMAHRGRLNVLANIMHKPFAAIFREFSGDVDTAEGLKGFDDMKYHLGVSSDRQFNGRNVHLSLTPNPSHLEAVSVVALGKSRAKQDYSRNRDRSKVMCLILHGDAAMAGQGIVSETFALSQLDGYRTGGTIHLIINNQIGFTTSPSLGRSSPYCSDVAKMVGAPILHVNGDDPEACAYVARIATEYRQRFQKDVVIDLWCYRRHGHSEIDEPKFTQPLMYKAIENHKSTRAIYSEKLVGENVLSAEKAKEIETQFLTHLDEEFKAAKSYKTNKDDWLEGEWEGLKAATEDAVDTEPVTGVEIENLQKVGKALSMVPANFNLHPKLQRFLDTRKKMFESGNNLDWATAEALAFGTLLCESNPVRLSGEDSQRGTFSQRHALLIDQNSEEAYIQLNDIQPGQARLEALDSPLSEFGVLGFEYGYSQALPNTLVLWEAQFGDFVNGAQVIIDQFIASGESKWLRMSGLVMLLPHGYEGQGPEHSSARPERFLMTCAQYNLQVCNVTTPANYFHLLRRQLRRHYRKPLILFTPKSLLRHKSCVSSFKDMAEGTSFKKILEDDLPGKVTDDKIRRVLLSTGKIYYDLAKERDNRKIKDIYLLRIEQLYPWPGAAIVAVLKKFPGAEIIWIQEEPENMGYWQFIDRKLEAVMKKAGMKNTRPNFIGRENVASPATGISKRHQMEIEHIIEQALTIPKKG